MNILLLLFAGDLITPDLEEIILDNQQAIERAQLTISKLENEDEDERAVATKENLLEEYLNLMDDGQELEVEDLTIQE